ncbi:MAG: S8 family serine peptidase [Tepidisphaeraceae bacterium]
MAGNGKDDDGNGYVDDVHGYDFIDHDPNAAGTDQHGTFVAGEIAARGDNRVGITGLAPLTQILPLRALDNERGLLSDAIEAINYVTTLRREGVNVPVINCSWTTEYNSPSLDQAIAAAGAANVLVVVAAGNNSNNLDRSPVYPAVSSRPNVLTVASTDWYDHLSYFSNYSATQVDLAAPGEAILSTTPGGGYGMLDGTSMAAPLVAAAAALLFSAAPSATALQVRSAIYSGSERRPDLVGKVASGGRLDAYGALARLLPTIPPRAPQLDAASDMGLSNADGVTRERQPTFAGSTLAGAKVEVFAGQTLLASTTADASGRYRVKTTSALADGTYVVQLVVTGSTGQKLRSGFSIVRIDTTASAPLAPAVVGRFGLPLDTPGVTSETSVWLSSTLQSDITGVDILVDGRSIGTRDVSATSGPTLLNDVPVPVGSHTIQVIAIDRAGNRSSPSAVSRIVVDQTPPKLVKARRDGSDRSVLWLDFDELLSANSNPTGQLSVRRSGAAWTLAIKSVTVVGASLRVQFAVPLPSGSLELTLNEWAVLDRALNGNDTIARYAITLT